MLDTSRRHKVINAFKIWLKSTQEGLETILLDLTQQSEMSPELHGQSRQVSTATAGKRRAYFLLAKKRKT